MSDGPDLHVAVRAELELARLLPKQYVDLANLRPATRVELDRRAMPVMPRTFTPELPQPAQVEAQSSSEGSSGADPDVPPPGPVRLCTIPKRRHWARYLVWKAAAEHTMSEWAAGREAPPPTYVCTQRQVHRWARGKVYDARDEDACTILTGSTRHTVFPGPRQMDRAQFRATCEAEGWTDVDPDIVATAGEGGVESCTTRDLTTVLRLHHPGVRAGFDIADGMIQAEYADFVAGAAVGHMAFWPTNAMPRDIVWKDKCSVGEGGELVVTESPRLTFDPSSGANSLNDGISKAQRTLKLPAIRDCAEGAAITDAAAQRAGGRAALFGADVKAAFPHMLLQRLEWPLHGFVWYCKRRRVLLFSWFYRCAFGAAYTPQRFGRVMAPIDAAGSRSVAAYFAAHPPHPRIREWSREREALQTAGMLPAGASQVLPRHVQRFVDDLQGSADNLPAFVPVHLVDIGVGADLTRALGGVPAPADCTASVVLRLLIANWLRHALTVAHDKTVLGDPVVALGARLSVAAFRIDQPPLRIAVIQQQISIARSQLAVTRDGRTTVDAGAVESLTGRLGFVSQFEPDLTGRLNVGYAISSLSRRVGVRAETRRSFPLVVANRMFGELRTLLDVGQRVTQANKGVPLAAAGLFPPLSHPLVLAASTDASFENREGDRDDGVGGFAWSRGSPGRVYIVSEPWPPRVRQALLNAARDRSVKAREPRRENLGMPAAELFGNWMVPYSIRHGLGVEGVDGPLQGAAAHVAPVFAHLASIGDCDPAAFGMRKGRSSRRQMNAMHLAVRDLTDSVLAVTVPRDFNFDADRLSHPSQLEGVVADARAAGFEPVVVRAPQECWAALEGWLALDDA